MSDDEFVYTEEKPYRNQAAEDALMDAIKRQDGDAAESAGLAGDPWANARVYQRLYVEAAESRDRYRDALEAIRSYCPNQPTSHPVDAAFDRIIAKVRVALDGMSREDWNDIANGRD